MLLLRPLLALSTLLAACNAVTVRIMPLGDSLTGGPGCWRALLWQRLQAAGITNTDFVGSQSAGGCGITFDGEHEGHGGFKATGIVADNQFPGWLASARPDVVMIMLGTNDVWNSLPTTTIITALSTLIDQARASNPSMKILVAKIPPMNPGGCTACDWPGQAKRLGDAIGTWAPGKSTSASSVSVVDCWTGFVAADFSDGVHVTDSGSVKLAECWFGGVRDAVLGFGGGGPSTTSVRTTSVVGVSTTTLSRSSTTLLTTTTRLVSSSTTTTTRPPPTTTSPLPTSRSTTTTTTTTTPSTGGPGAPLWGQCGGNGWTGPTTCASGTCKFSNAWYSQCLL